jgi:hypothetical protein
MVGPPKFSPGDPTEVDVEPGTKIVVKVPLGARRKPKDPKFWLISS